LQIGETVGVNANELRRLLFRHGCHFASHRVGGSHLTVTRLVDGTIRTSQPPIHGKKELGTGLVNKILKDLDLKGVLR